MERILCVWSPNWAIDNWKRRNPAASPADAFALVLAERRARRLYAVDEGAARLGLFVGQKAAAAQALAPELTTADADPAADSAALTALADWCARFSPAVAPAPPDSLFLDITGVAHLWGGETAMAADLAARLSRNGLAVRTAIASGPGAAWALAHFDPGDVAAPPEREAERLFRLPTAALRLPPAETAQIARLGLTTIGALAALPQEQIARRFGPMVGLRLNQALGRAPEALSFRRPPNPWFARLVFVEPICTPEGLAWAAADIATRLCARLEAEGQGARRFELGFHRLDEAVQRLWVGLALPGREPRSLARLFASKLEAVDPGFGIEAATLAAEGVQPLAVHQGRLDRGREVAPEEGVAPLVDRLTNRLGEGAVWRSEAWPSHDPERMVARRPPLALPSPRGGGWDPERPRPLRLLRRPEPIEAVAPVPDDPPVLFRWRGAPHRVRRAEGPERLAEEWWRRLFETADPARARDYYRVEDEAGGRFWLFRDGLYQAEAQPKWWLHGLFG
jgi:protein ImuB